MTLSRRFRTSQPGALPIHTVGVSRAGHHASLKQTLTDSRCPELITVPPYSGADPGDAGTVSSAVFDGGITSICGDNELEGDEECDDGNTVANDGCSPTCQLEPGFTCQKTDLVPSARLSIPIVYRDFRGYDLPPVGDLPRGHIDFQNANQLGAEKGLVQNTLNALGKPAYAKTGQPSVSTSGAATFAQWFVDTALVNKPVVETLNFYRYPSGEHVVYAPDFFPLDNLGWVAAGVESHRTTYDVPLPGHNYSFTNETRFWFAYKGTERFSFQGDDDVWVFINRRLVIDLGGTHVTEYGAVNLSTQATQLGLSVGGIYEVAVFHAERRTSRSSYQIALYNFSARRSQCVPIAPMTKVKSPAMTE